MAELGEYRLCPQPVDTIKAFAGAIALMGEEAATRSFDMRIDFGTTNMGRVGRQKSVIEVYGGSKTLPTGLFAAQSDNFGDTVECRSEVAGTEQTAASLDDMATMLRQVLAGAPWLGSPQPRLRLVPTFSDTERFQAYQDTFVPFAAELLHVTGQAIADLPDGCESHILLDMHSAGPARFMPTASRRSRIYFRNLSLGSMGQVAFDMHFWPGGRQLEEHCTADFEVSRSFAESNTVTRSIFMQRYENFGRRYVVLKGGKAADDRPHHEITQAMLGLARSVTP